jgi:hypothetical protein
MMNQGKYVFAQVTAFLPQRVFDGLVTKYQGNYRVRHFTCWNQLLCMMFGQLSNRDSLRDLVLTINAHQKKMYHLGFGKGVSKTNLAIANEQRNWKIYLDFANSLITEAKKTCVEDTTNFPFPNSVYAFDSTTIKLCLNVFCWATFRNQEGGIKLHTQYDVRTSIPVFIDVTNACVHDINAMDKINYEPNSFYIFDRGYLDYTRLHVIHSCRAYFVIRPRKTLQFKRLYSVQVDKSTGVRSDQIGQLKYFYSRKGYPDKIRKIRFYDVEQKRTLIFLTNNLLVPSDQIAALYKNRWKIELFFKWIKQHLRITSFWGRTENAVLTQVYTAIITYCAVAIIRQKLQSSYSTYEVLQILGASLLDKTPLNELLKKKNNQDVKELLDNQLKIF